MAPSWQQLLVWLVCTLVVIVVQPGAYPQVIYVSTYHYFGVSSLNVPLYTPLTMPDLVLVEGEAINISVSKDAMIDVS